MNQNAAGVDVSGKWFFDRFSPVTHIKAIGNADVTYGLAIDGEKRTNYRSCSDNVMSLL